MTISNDAAWPRPAYAWYVVAVLSVANLFSFLDRTVLNLLVTPVKRALSLSDTEIGLVQGAAFGIFYTLMILPFGWLADRTARNRIVSLGIAFWSVMTAACGLAGSFLQLFAARVGVGIGEATLSAAVGSLVSDHFPAERRTLPLSVYTMVGSMGAGVALLLGGVVAELITGVDHVDLPLLGTLQPWQVVFIAVGAPGVAWSLLSLTIREPVRRESTGDAATTAELLAFLSRHRRIVAPHFFGYCFYNTFGYGAAAWIPAYFMRVHGWSMGDVGFRYGLVYFVFAVVGGYLGGILPRLFLRRGRADANLLTVSLGNLALAVPGVLVTSVADPWSSLALTAPLIVLFVFPSGPSLAAVQEITPNRLRGRMTALYYAVTNMVGISLGALTIGLITDHVFADEMAVGRSIALAGAVLCPIGALIVYQGARARRALGSLAPGGVADQRAAANSATS